MNDSINLKSEARWQIVGLIALAMLLVSGLKACDMCNTTGIEISKVNKDAAEAGLKVEWRSIGGQEIQYGPAKVNP